MRKLFRKIRQARFNYKPLIEVQINKSALIFNLRAFQNLSDNKIAPVLKSNAYGHGLVEVAKIVDQEDIPFIVVDSYYEALILRNEGIKKPVLIIGYTQTENILNSKLTKVAFTITSEEQLQELTTKVSKPTTFHLKFDTGMHRQGIILQSNNRNELFALLNQNPNLIIEGICSHLADADEDTHQLTSKQIKTWNNIVELFKQNFPKIKYYHLAATSGLLFNQNEQEKIQANVARLGLGLYGLNQSTFQNIELQLALSMNSIVTSWRTLQPGDKTGYNFTYEARQPMQVATVPAGYFEGVDRRLSNKGIMMINNQPCPILGNVSMNITSLDVTQVPNIKVGTSVNIISNHPADPNSISNIAKTCQTVPYEILVHLPQKLRRTIIE